MISVYFKESELFFLLPLFDSSSDLSLPLPLKILLSQLLSNLFSISLLTILFLTALSPPISSLFIFSYHLTSSKSFVNKLIKPLRIYTFWLLTISNYLFIYIILSKTIFSTIFRFLFGFSLFKFNIRMISHCSIQIKVEYGRSEKSM